MGWRASICLAVLGFSAWSAPTPARAYEDTATLGLAVGWAGNPNSASLPQNGLSLGLSAGFGIGDAWAITGIASYALFPGDRPFQMGVAGLETLYFLDLVRFVPILGAGLDGIVSGQSGSRIGDFALHGLLGFDFLIDRRWLVGADVRAYWITTSGRSPLDPFFITAAARVGVRFGTR